MNPFAEPDTTPIADRLASIRILYRRSDTLTLYGIPYLMRPGQQPGDLYRADRQRTSDLARRRYGTYDNVPARSPIAEWMYLGEPGWFGTYSREDCDTIKLWLASLPAGVIPGGPEEWAVIEDWQSGEVVQP